MRTLLGAAVTTAYMLTFAVQLLHADEAAAIKSQAGLDNVYRISPQLYSGSTPVGDAGLKSLASLGVKTIVSVDGSEPAVAAAKRYGMRYVHIPFGYDGIPGKARGALTRVMKQLPQPVYIHCHHGKHRGPAAAAIAAIAAGSYDQRGAATFLQTAGTSRRYSGLWRDVQAFKPLPAGAKLPELRSYTAPQPMARIMVAINHRYEKLAELHKLKWQPPQPGQATAAQLSLLLAEDFRELKRQTSSTHGDDFKQELETSEKSSLQIESSLRAGDKPAATKAFAALKSNCTSCHANHRD